MNFNFIYIDFFLLFLSLYAFILEHRNNMDIRVEEEQKEWLERNMVGRMYDINKFGSLKECFIIKGLDFINTKYPVNTMVLFSLAKKV